MRIAWSGFVVDRDHIAIWVTKAECAPEGSIGRGRYDLDTCLRQRVVDVLGIFGVKPKSYADNPFLLPYVNRFLELISTQQNHDRASA